MSRALACCKLCWHPNCSLQACLLASSRVLGASLLASMVQAWCKLADIHGAWCKLASCFDQCWQVQGTRQALWQVLDRPASGSGTIDMDCNGC